jgi:hypothetical protein
MAHGPGTEAATGKLVAIRTIPNGRAVCVRDAKSARKLCGETHNSEVLLVLRHIGVGDCAHVEVARDALRTVERRRCT